MCICALHNRVMEVLAALFCAVFILWLAWRWQHTSTFQKLGIPGPKPNLIFGNLIELYKKGPLKCHEEWVSKYGRVLGYYYGMRPVLMVTDSALLKNIFIRDFNKFIDREVFNPLSRYDPHDKEMQSVIHMPGQAWKNVRSVLSRTFTAAKMKQMTGSMTSSVDDMLKLLKDQQGKEVDIFDVYQRLTMDIITRTAFGVRTDVITNPKSKLLNASRLIFGTFYKDYIVLLGLSFPMLRRLCWKLKTVYLAVRNYGQNPLKILGEEVRKVIQYRRKNPQIKSIDLLQLMIDSRASVGDTEEAVSKLGIGNVENEKKLDSEVMQNKETRGLTDGEIFYTSRTILLAGYETTSTALAFTTYLLAKHQDIQENLFQEIDEIIKKGESLDYATANKLGYLDKVLSESMRVYPPVTLFTNRYALEDVHYDDLFIPQGTLIQAPVYLMHHDPKFWSDPETFDPERFEDKPNTDGISYLPFGVGPRNCLGMRFAQLEAKLALAKTVHKFQLSLADRHLRAPLRVVSRIRTLTPIEGVHVKLQLREKAN